MRYLICILAVLAVCTGCVEEVREPAGLPIDARNFTLVLQCAGAGNLSMNVTGNAYINKYEFGRSNCSVQLDGRTIRLHCPREPLRISWLGRDGTKLLHRVAQD